MRVFAKTYYDGDSNWRVVLPGAWLHAKPSVPDTLDDRELDRIARELGFEE